MNALLRSLLVCFLLLALPFRALAGAGMPPAPPDSAPCHQSVILAHADKADQQARHEQHEQYEQQTARHMKSKCGHCAACCIGAAMAPPLPAGLPLAPRRFVSVPFRAGYLPSVFPLLPERPPRTRFA